MRVNIKVKEIRSIEAVAMCLLAAEIPFEYMDSYLKVKGSGFLSGMSATYVSGSGQLCLMDGDYNQISIEQFIEAIRPDLKPLAKIV